MGEIRVPVLVKAQRGAVCWAWALSARLGSEPLPPWAADRATVCRAEADMTDGGDSRWRAPPTTSSGASGAAKPLGGRAGLLVLLRAVRALMLLDVAAEDEGVSGLEQALSQLKVWRGVLQLLVQVEIVLAFAAVAALVTVEGPPPVCTPHVLDELVGGLGQVAALVALVVVAQAMRAGVRLQLQLVGRHRLGRSGTCTPSCSGSSRGTPWRRGGWWSNCRMRTCRGRGARTGEVSPAGSREYPSPAASRPPASCPRPPSRLQTRPGPAQPGPAASWDLGGSAADRAIPWPARGQESPGCTGGCQPPVKGNRASAPGWGHPAKLFSSPVPTARPPEPSPPPLATAEGSPQDLPSRWEQHKESTFHAPHQAHAERLRVLKNSL